MTIEDMLTERKMSVYRLSKTSGIPYTTLNDICSGKAYLGKCSADTVYKLARALDISMEDLLRPVRRHHEGDCHE